MSDVLSKFKGCILGGAIGDSLGYPVEFLKMDEIIEEYGKDGITKQKLYNNKALVSDDTQMTLFTMEGLIQEGEDILDSIYNAYLDWLKTQHYKTIQKGRSSLFLSFLGPHLQHMEVPRLGGKSEL